MFKIGADPEFFVRDRSTGKFVSAHGLIPGTKREPFHVDKGAVQVDGMALEFNINPASTVEEFSDNIRIVLGQLREMVDPQLEFVFEPVAHFGKEYIDAQPAAAKELGCEPDYNAWTGKVNPKPNSDMGFRTASGHVHIGWTEQQDITHPDHVEACQMMVKQLDYYLGVPALLWDQDEIRSSMYGAPGAYRPKNYGVEYRVLSNMWLNSPNTIAYVFNQSMSAAQQLMEQNQVWNKGYSIKSIHNMNNNDIYSIIRYIFSHKKSNDLRFLSDLKASIKERPSIIERERKINEEFYFINNDSELVPFEEAGKGCTHPNQYVKVCRDYKLGKPTSIKHAEELFNNMYSNPSPSTSAKKKSIKIETRPWALSTNSTSGLGFDILNYTSTRSIGEI